MTHWREFLDPSAPSGGYLPWKEVARRTSLSRTTAWRLQKRDEFPRPYAISPGRVGLLACEVEAWIASRQRPAGRTAPGSAPSARPGLHGGRSSEGLRASSGSAAAEAAQRPAPFASGTGPGPKASQKRRGQRTAGSCGQQITFDF